MTSWSNVRAPARRAHWQGDKEAPPRDIGRHQRRPVDRAQRQDRQARAGLRQGRLLDLREGVTEKYPDAAYHMGSPGASIAIATLLSPERRAKRTTRRARHGRARVGPPHTASWCGPSIPSRIPAKPGYETSPRMTGSAGSPAYVGALPPSMRARADFLPIGSARAAILWRRPARAESVFVFDRGAGRELGKGPLVFPAHAPRRVGLRRGGRPAFMESLTAGRKIAVVVAVSKPA